MPAGSRCSWASIHARFVAALTATASIRLAGETLELRDREGKVRMRLEARYLR